MTGKEKVLPDYDVVVGSSFAGSTATLSFLEATEKAGQVGRVALMKAGKKGIWPGTSRWKKPSPRLSHDRQDRCCVETFGRIIGAIVSKSLPETTGDIVAGEAPAKHSCAPV